MFDGFFGGLFDFDGNGNLDAFEQAVDTMAFAVLKLKERYPNVRLILALPCLAQTRGWSREDVEIYEDIKRKADKVVYTSQEYTRGCMHKRNLHLVDNSSACIAYLTESKGGTSYTVDYAEKTA